MVGEIPNQASSRSTSSKTVNKMTGKCWTYHQECRTSLMLTRLGLEGDLKNAMEAMGKMITSFLKEQFKTTDINLINIRTKKKDSSKHTNGSLCNTLQKKLAGGGGKGA